MNTPLPPAPAPVAPSQDTRGGLSTAAMVLGIVGTLTGLGSPIDWAVTLILGILAVVFGAKGKGRGRRGQAIAGFVLGLIAIVLAIAGYGAFVQANGS